MGHNVFETISGDMDQRWPRREVGTCFSLIILCNSKVLIMQFRNKAKLASAVKTYIEKTICFT